LTESQKQFLDEFMKWSQEDRDRYTKEVLKWFGDILETAIKAKGIGVLMKALKENKEAVERFPIIFIYAVKPEFREEVARIVRLLNAVIRMFPIG